MRISDWNSDVCSSELHVVIGRAVEERRMQWIHADVDMLRVDRAVHDRLRPARPVGGFVAREVRPHNAGRRQGVAGGEPKRTRSAERSLGKVLVSSCRNRWPDETNPQKKPE